MDTQITNMEERFYEKHCEFRGQFNQYPEFVTTPQKVFAFIQSELQEQRKKDMEELTNSIHSFANYLRDHYWDSLEKDRGLITKHIDDTEKNFLDQLNQQLTIKKEDGR